MINGWYCRSIASDQVDQDYSNNLVVKSETSDEEEPSHLMDHRLRYKSLKKKLKFLVYENEFLADTLRTSQHNFLKVAKDRSFLLDRLLQYEQPESSSESNDDSDSSDDDVPMTKKKKIENIPAPPTYRQAVPVTKQRKRVIQKKAPVQQQDQKHHHQQPPPHLHPQNSMTGTHPVVARSQSNVEIVQEHRGGTVSQNIMTTEEVERHLQSRQSLIELRAPPTVPTEMFSNEPSLDSEGDDKLIETSPSNLTEDCLSMDMSMMQD